MCRPWEKRLLLTWSEPQSSWGTACSCYNPVSSLAPAVSILHMGLGAAPFSGHQLTFTQPSTSSFLCSSALQMHQGISISVAYHFWCVCYDLTPPWPCTRNPLQNSIWFSCAVSYIIAWSKWRCFPVRLVKFASENKHQKCWVRKSHLHVMWEKNNSSQLWLYLYLSAHTANKRNIWLRGVVFLSRECFF